MTVDATEEGFDLLELFGYTVLFTRMRVDRRTVSKWLYAYDM